MTGSLVSVGVTTADDQEIDVQAWRAEGDGLYEFDIIGESRYQAELWSIVGDLAEDAERAEHECTAILLPVSDNPHDANAVEVHIEGRQVGYLSREDAADFRGDCQELMEEIEENVPIVICDAMIVGGFRQRDGSRASLGVKLDLELPLI